MNQAHFLTERDRAGVGFAAECRSVTLPYSGQLGGFVFKQPPRDPLWLKSKAKHFLLPCCYYNFSFELRDTQVAASNI